jgi:simple sugar transport system substrate-binding protein
MGFDCNKWALRELLAGNWNYDGQCSPFQAKLIDGYIKSGKVPSKKVINEEKGFDAKTLTQADIDTYGLGD